MQCLTCRNEIPDISNYCLHCGTRLTSTKQDDARPAILQIVRFPAFAGSLARMNIFIDGTGVGVLKNDSTESFKVLPGTHSILLTCGQAKSASTELHVAPGEAAGIVCGLVAGVWRNRIFLKAFYGAPRQ